MKARPRPRPRLRLVDPGVVKVTLIKKTRVPLTLVQRRWQLALKCRLKRVFPFQATLPLEISILHLHPPSDPAPPKKKQAFRH